MLTLPTRYKQIEPDNTYWTIEEYKFWAGLEKTCWARRFNYMTDSWGEANEMLNYLVGNCPDLILRVSKWTFPDAKPAEKA